MIFGLRPATSSHAQSKFEALTSTEEKTTLRHLPTPAKLPSGKRLHRPTKGRSHPSGCNAIRSRQVRRQHLKEPSLEGATIYAAPLNGGAQASSFACALFRLYRAFQPFAIARRRNGHRLCFWLASRKAIEDVLEVGRLIARNTPYASAFTSTQDMVSSQVSAAPASGGKRDYTR